MKNEFYELREYIYSLLYSFTPLSEGEFKSAEIHLATKKNELMRYFSDLSVRTVPSTHIHKKFRQYQRSIVITADHIHQQEEAGHMNHPQQKLLVAQVKSGIFELLNHIEFEYPDYFDLAIPMPRMVLAQQQLVFPATIAPAIDLMRQVAIPAGLITVLEAYGSDFCTRGNLTYYDRVYFEKIFHSIPDWLGRHKTETAETILQRVLCYYNFNRMAYLDYLRDSFFEQIADIPDFETQIITLHRALLLLETMLHSDKWHYHDEHRPSVYDHGISVINKLITSKKNDRVYEPSSEEKRGKLPFLFNGAQWSIIIERGDDKKYFGDKITRNFIAKQISETFCELDQKALRHESIRRNDTKHKDEDIVALHAFYKGEADWIKKQYPHLF